MANVEQSAYGKTPDRLLAKKVHLFTLTNSHGLRARLISYGAILVSMEVPNRRGEIADVTLGYDTLDEWIKGKCYFGATVGRYANRIAGGEFVLDGRTYALAANDGPNHLHGGLVGFNKAVWDARPVRTPKAAGVRFAYLSPDGEEGYPGHLSVTVTYTLSETDELRIEYAATTDKPTVVNLTNHAYWNLAGSAAGLDVLGHELTLYADHFTPVDEHLIPTGEVAPVAGTPLDFTSPTAIGARIGQVGNGYDHNYVIRRRGPQCVPAARVREPRTGRVMEVHTTEPGVQLYTGNFLDGTQVGKGGVAYGKHWGFCLEAQHYPDSPNKPSFPTVVLRPGQTYKQLTVHRFLAD